MAIRREHFDISTIGQLGQKAGEAQAAKEQARIAAQAASQLRDINARKELAEFNAQLSIEAEKRQQVWELEKMQRRSENDFALEEQRRRILQTKQLEKQLREQEETELKMKALQNATEKGLISPEEANRRIIELHTGLDLGKPEDQMELRRDVEGDFDYYMELMNSFAENVDVNPGFFSRADIAPLAVVDDEGNPVREATPQEKAQYEYAKRRINELQPLLGMTGANPQTTGVTIHRPLTGETFTGVDPNEAQALINDPTEGWRLVK